MEDDRKRPREVHSDAWWENCCAWIKRSRQAAVNMLPNRPTWRHGPDDDDTVTIESEVCSSSNSQASQVNCADDTVAENSETQLHVKKGFALILNHNEFIDKDLPPRAGTNHDEQRMRQLLESFGFTVETLHDGHTIDVLRKINQVAADYDYQDHDCILVLVNTHGLAGGILCAKDNCFNVEDVWRPFLNNKNLDHLPKIFIFQACKGHKTDTGKYFRSLSNDSNASYDEGSAHNSQPRSFNGDSQNSNQAAAPMISNELHPNHPNVLMAFSTVENYVSWRDSATGTFYIKALCSVLEKQQGRDFVSLLTDVHRLVSKDSARTTTADNTPLGVYKQTPSFTSSLTYKIYFHSRNNSET